MWMYIVRIIRIESIGICGGEIPVLGKILRSFMESCGWKRFVVLQWMSVDYLFTVFSPVYISVYVSLHLSERA